jgi:hypothetical protein
LDRRDKTLFDESIMANVDYPRLRQLLIDPKNRIDGVDYGPLRARLEHETWNSSISSGRKDLAGINAFLSLW